MCIYHAYGLPHNQTRPDQRPAPWSSHLAPSRETGARTPPIHEMKVSVPVPVPLCHLGPTSFKTLQNLRKTKDSTDPAV